MKTLSYRLCIVALFLLARCGSVPPATVERTSLVVLQPQATATTPPMLPATQPPLVPEQVSTPLPDPAVTSSSSAFLTEDIVTLRAGGATWHLRQPQGVPPLYGVSKQGILWVEFPSLIMDGLGWGNKPRATGDYAIRYTPLRSEGGDLEQASQLLLAIPGTIPADNSYTIDVQYILAVDVVVDDRFLVHSYRSMPTAQNGGKISFWWIEPGTGKTQLITSTTGEGGGHHLQFTHNGRWLFWNRSETTEQATVAHGQAFLVDLQTGKEVEIHLGGNSWTEDVQWGADGKLHFTLQSDGRAYWLDPATYEVHAAS